jgi:hypothetical protein
MSRGGARTPGGAFTVEKGKELIAARQDEFLDDADICLQCGVTFDTVRGWFKKGLRAGAPPEFVTFSEGWARAKIKRKKYLIELVHKSALDYDGDNPHCRGAANSAMWLLSRLEQGRLVRHMDFEEILAEVQGEDDTVDQLLTNPPEELIDGFRRNLPALKALLLELETEKALPVG